jgi:hypothetical protein
MLKPLMISIRSILEFLLDEAESNFAFIKKISTPTSTVFEAKCFLQNRSNAFAF